MGRRDDSRKIGPADRELEEKYLELAVPVIGDGPAWELLARCWRLEQFPRIA